MPNLDFTFAKDSILNVLPFSKSYKRIYLHQSQTYNSTIVNSANKFTFENAKYEGNISSEMLYRTIHYFKKRNKKVILFTHSYGSFVTPNYLALKPNIADKIVVMAGRLNMDEKIWKSFSNGKMKGFEEDGITVKEGLEVENIMMKLLLSTKTKEKMVVPAKLAARIGHKRFTELLSDKDLSNVLYIYGTKDESVGSLSADEIRFLKEKKVSIIKLDGGHSSMFNSETLSDISNFISTPSNHLEN